MMQKAGGEVIVIPTGYKKVSAVGKKSTGNTYCHVDTLVAPTDSTKIYIQYRYVLANSSANQIIGCANNNQGTGGLIVFLDALRWKSGDIGSWATPTAETIYEVTAWRDGSTIHYLKNGVDKSGTPGGSISTTHSLWLLGRNQNGNRYGNSPACMIYRMKIWDGTALVRDFIPCVRDEDGKPGFYDVANNQFYTRMSGTNVELQYEA